MTRPPVRRPARSGARTTLSILLGGVAVVGLVASLVAVWAHQTLFDPGSVARSVDATLRRPEVDDALATYLTDQTLGALSSDTTASGSPLPGLLAPGADTGDLRTAVHEQYARLLASDTIRQVVVDAAGQSHRSLLRVLDRGGLVDGVTVHDGAVSVNLLPVVSRGLAALQSGGLLTGVRVPDLRPDGDPQAQIAQLEAALGTTLPADLGQLVVYRSSSLGSAGELVARAQQALVLFRRAILLVVALTLACLLASVLVAVRRRHALVALALAIAASAVVTRLLVDGLIHEAAALAPEPGGRVAIHTMLSTLTASLQDVLVIGLASSLVLSAVLALTGRRHPLRDGLRGGASS